MAISNSRARLSCTARIQAKGGGEWQENTLGAVQAAVTRMDWKPYARKVIVLIGDSPPEKQDFAPLVALIWGFRRNNGTVSGVDVQEEEHERYQRAFWIKVHRTEPTPKEIGPLPQFAKQAQAAYKVLAVEGGGSIRSLSHERGHQPSGNDPGVWRQVAGRGWPIRFEIGAWHVIRIAQRQTPDTVVRF